MANIRYGQRPPARPRREGPTSPPARHRGHWEYEPRRDPREIVLRAACACGWRGGVDLPLIDPPPPLLRLAESELESHRDLHRPPARATMR